MSTLIYRQAAAIAADLSDKDTKPAFLLKDLIKRTKREATFLIMRYGDPANWRGPIALKRGRPPKTDYTVAGKKRQVGPFAIRHLETGQLVTGNTIRELVQKAGLPDTKASQRSIGHLASGRRQKAEGWFPAPILDQTVALKDIYGNDYPVMTVREACLEHGLKPHSVRHLISGHKRFFRGLALQSTQIDTTIRPRNWRFSTIMARVGSRNVRASSIPDLSRKTGIAPADLYAIAYGFKERSDIKLTDIQIERKAVLQPVDAVPVAESAFAVY